MGVMIITVKTRAEWLKEVQTMIEIAQKYKDLNEFAEKDIEHCGRLLIAFESLGQPISQELKDKCKVRDFIPKEEFLSGGD